MTVLERALLGLSACIPISAEDEKIGCSTCPYGCCKADAVRLPIQMIEDIREVLKAQKPHIVTIADYENNPIVDKDGNLAVWQENRPLNGIAYHNDGWVILNRNRVEGLFNSEMIRFWTSRPTDEQREAIPWQA